jgi:hypothetical protein
MKEATVIVASFFIISSAKPLQLMFSAVDNLDLKAACLTAGIFQPQRT